MSEVTAFMPNEAELFPEPHMELDDLRLLQKNSVFQAMIQRLRGEAYRAGMLGNPTKDGLMRAIEVIGATEFELQREPHKEDDEEQ